MRERVSSRWLALCGCGVLLIAAAALRVPGLVATPLWWDEERTLALAQTSVADIIGTGASVHPPGYPLLAHAALALYPESWVIRCPALLGSLLGVVLMWWGFRRFGLASRSWGGAAILALSVYQVYYATEARGYSWMMSLVLWSVFATARYLTAPRAALLAEAILASAAAIGFHYLAAPAVVPLVLVAFTASILRIAKCETRERVATLVIWLACIAAVGAAAVLLRARLATAADYLALPAAARVRVNPQLGAELLGRWSGLGRDLRWPVVVIVTVGALWCLRSERRLGVALLLAAASPLLIMSCLPWPHFFEARYLAAASLPMLALFTLGLGAVSSAAARGIGRAVHAAAVRRAGAATVWALVLVAELIPSSSFARQPRKFAPAGSIDDFGFRHVALHSRLQPWTLRSVHERDYDDLVEGTLPPLAFPVPRWQEIRSELAAGSASRVWKNELADDVLSVRVVAPAGATSVAERPEVVLAAPRSAITGASGGVMLLRGRFPSAGVSFELELVGFRDDSMRRYLEEVARRVRLVPD